MRATTTLTTNVLAGPVLIIRQGLQDHIIAPDHRDDGKACLCRATAVISLDDLAVVATGNPSSFDLLDLADATWEDAEWQ